ncbi:PP2C family protein-serine/threonine phosphatase [Nonomuraea diastatica]|uniref:Serine/threonine-protein phosphatase n=1 Tax=Nonomuraea diastatica TaxID=1848329 RepID=A0A4R4X598_9ACTN|nr:PP2C family protein-serine/threonine phosphatase [Nonomuraea diastatica]TDD25482.1 serine/threonine-protein phosphatase [Nonomuraea diastatica]
MRCDGELMLGGLLEAAHLIALEQVPGVVAEHARLAGFTRPLIYVTDLQQQRLVPLPGQSGDNGEVLDPILIDTTLAGRAFRNVEIVRSRRGPDTTPRPEEEPRVWVPILDGTDRLGVLQVTLPDLGELAERRVVHLASLLSLILATKRAHSDSYARLVRIQPMTLSAEVLFNLLPPGAFANDRVVVSAMLEPAYEVGGDAYDYAIDGHTLHVSIFDAMGHDTSAGLTATVAMGACRNARIQGADLTTAGEAIDEAIAEQFTGRFATGILADLDLRTGELSWVNRGHHPPLVLRGGRWVATLAAEPDPPMGFRLGAGTGLLGYQLQPGDRLVFYTDGIIEAQSPNRELFGLKRFIDFLIRHEADGLTVPETLRRLIQAILKHQRGRLQDDATVLVVEWQSRTPKQLVL